MNNSWSGIKGVNAVLCNNKLGHFALNQIIHFDFIARFCRATWSRTNVAACNCILHTATLTHKQVLTTLIGQFLFMQQSCSVQHAQLHTETLSHDKVARKNMRYNCRCDICLKVIASCQKLAKGLIQKPQSHDEGNAFSNILLPWIYWLGNNPIFNLCSLLVLYFQDRQVDRFAFYDVSRSWTFVNVLP